MSHASVSRAKVYIYIRYIYIYGYNIVINMYMYRKREEDRNFISVSLASFFLPHAFLLPLPLTSSSFFSFSSLTQFRKN